MNKILITGAGGFIGSHLAEKCVQSGYFVKALVRYNSRNNWGWLENSEYKNEMEIISGDVRDYDSVYNTLKGCDTVFHLAALIGIPYSYLSPLAYIKTNIEGTYNVLQAAKELKTNNILVTSTSETYGTAQYIPINEQHPLVGQSPYSASKIAADQMALSYYRSFGLPVKIVRPFNTYGPRQSARAFIPTVISQLLDGKKQLNLGNLNPTRDLTFVKDSVSGFLAIANSEKLYGEITNIGMNEEISVGNLSTLIIELIGKKVEILQDEIRIRPEKSEVDRLFCDNSKIINKTDWKPKYTLQMGLKETIDWFSKKENLAKYKTDIYNI